MARPLIWDKQPVRPRVKFAHPVVEGIDDPWGGVFGDGVDGHGGPESGVANQGDGVFFGMIETDNFRVDIAACLE